MTSLSQDETCKGLLDDERHSHSRERLISEESTPIIVRKPKTIRAMLETKHHWLPVVLAILLPATFVITYAIAVEKGHVEAGFPYISDTGTFPPESCVFGQLLNIGAVISGIIIYIRYRHIYTLFENIPETKGLLNLNLAAFWVGMVSSLGVSMVGNFQESNVFPVHYLGAVLAFIIGWIYCVLQNVISFKTAGTSEMMGNTHTIRTVRVVVSVLAAIFLLMVMVASKIAGDKGPGDGIKSYNWTHSDPGFAEHLIATISEWLAAFAIVIYFSTFYHGFKHFRITAPQIIQYNTTTENEEQLGQRHQITPSTCCITLI